MKYNKKAISFIIFLIVTIGIYSVDFTKAVVGGVEYVKSYYLNVRNTNYYRGKVIDIVANGDKLQIIEEYNNGWKKVKLENGSYGYVNGKYLQSEYIKPMNVVEGNQAKLIVNRGFMRIKPAGRVNAVLKEGEKMQLLSDRYVYGKWAKVRILDGHYKFREGYISKNIISTYFTYNTTRFKNTIKTVIPKKLNKKTTVKKIKKIRPNRKINKIKPITGDSNEFSSEEEDIKSLFGGLDLESEEKPTVNTGARKESGEEDIESLFGGFNIDNNSSNSDNSTDSGNTSSGNTTSDNTSSVDNSNTSDEEIDIEGLFNF